jgi:hypothetical protein
LTTNTHQRNELILITDISPELAGSGSQHLKDIIKCLDAYSRLKIVHVNATSIDYHRSRPPALDCSALRSSDALVHVTVQTMFENTSFDYSDQTGYLHRIRINAHRFFAGFDREMAAVRERSTVAIFVQWPGMIFLWEAFARSNWRTVPILMDRYEPLFISFPLAKACQALIRDSFDLALNHSDGLLVGSKKAAHAYTPSLQVPCREIMSMFRGDMTPIAVRHSVGLAKLRRLANAIKPTISIALAGQIYARDATGLFLDAMARLNDMGSADEGTYCLDYYGENPIRAMYPQTCIVVHGALEYEKLMDVIAESCVFGLVPYSFDSLFSTSAKFSFPSKLVAYVQAGVIPIYMGPRDSSVFDLLSEFDLAHLCITSENPTLIVEQLAAIVAGDLIAMQAKLLTLSAQFKPEYLQNCINDVFNRIS